MDTRLLSAELIRDERLRLKPYTDSVGKMTIGVGRNLADKGITAEEAAMLLDDDVAGVVADLDRALPWWRGLSEVRQRALANMCFNLGINRLLGFRQMLAALQAGDYPTAAAEALDSQWAKQVGDRAQRIEAMIRQG